MQTSSKKYTRAIFSYVGQVAHEGRRAHNRTRRASSKSLHSWFIRVIAALFTYVLCQASATAVGPTTDPTSIATTAYACSGVQISPGMSADSIQSAVDSHPSGTVFCFASGTYVLNKYVTLKDSDQFICVNRRTCVLTGLDQYRGALTAAFNSAHQIIRGFVVEHFIAVSGSWPNAGLQLRDNGLIDDNEIRFNQNGITVTSNQTISSNYIHDNAQYGISGGPLSNLIIENNDLSSNNTAKLDPNFDASGSKIVGGLPGTNFVTWRNNHVHDNYGQGIWHDGNVRNVLIEGNLVENNWGAGIDHEISWDATIRGNVVRNNMKFELNQGFSCWHGAQIAVTNSQNLTITGNTIEGVNTNALCLANSTRTEPSVFPQALANVTVSNNVVKLSGAVNMGAVGDSVASGISFTGNSYYVDVLSNPYWSLFRSMGWQAWNSAGQDTAGSLFPSANWTGSNGGTSSGGTTGGTGGTTGGTGGTTGGTGGTTGGTGGSLAGSGTATFAAVNLTTTGTGDWAKWPDYIHKASGGSQISNFTMVNPSTPHKYLDDRRPLSWSDGTPTASASNETTGLFSLNVGNGFQFSAPADTTTRKLLVYVGGWNSSGKLVAHLSDGSAADFVDASFSGTSQYKVVYTITYRAASAGQRLTVKWTQGSGTGNVTLQAAALQ